MSFLFKPKSRAFQDESLESYLLRVVQENFFDSYRQLSQSIRDELYRLDIDAYGAFPLELRLLNLYHASDSSLFRVRAIELFESLLRLQRYELLKLALFRSDNQIFSPKTVLHRAGVNIPLSFLRDKATESFSIPVCPECLKKEPYIRQVWHLKLYKACQIHNLELISCCPKCGLNINYILHESITHCLCGFDLSKHKASVANVYDYQLSSALFDADSSSKNPLLYNQSLNIKISALAWYAAQYSGSSFDSLKIMQYFESWPSVFVGELDQRKEAADFIRIEHFNKTAFNDIFGNLIPDAFHLGRGKSEPHFITETVLEYLIKLVSEHPKSSKANIADLLINISEAAALLSTSYEQVYRLYESGILKIAHRQRLHQKLSSHQAVFHLRQVIELKKSYGGSYKGMYVSKW